MIKKENIFQIGKIIKPHGLQGELSFEFSTDIFDEVEIPYFICEIDGIFVPYFIESYRLKGDDTGLIKFEGIDSDKDAKELSKTNLYLERALLPSDLSSEDIQSIDFYIGYRIIDQNENIIGEIISFDDSTENILFNILSNSDTEILIPACDDYILEIDDSARIIRMEIPDGLLELD